MRTFFESWLFVIALWLLVIGVWIFGLAYELQFQYWWFDVVVHFWGGVWIFVFLWNVRQRANLEISGTRHAVALFISLIGVVALAGVFWEFGEFIADRYIFNTGFTWLSGVFEDTLLDLLMDMLGGVFGFLFYYSYIFKNL